MVDCLPPTTFATCFCFLALLLSTKLLFSWRPYNSRPETTIPQSSCVAVTACLVWYFVFFLLVFASLACLFIHPGLRLQLNSVVVEQSSQKSLTV